jgi:hypothetical protein
LQKLLLLLLVFTLIFSQLYMEHMHFWNLFSFYLTHSGGIKEVDDDDMD